MSACSKRNFRSLLSAVVVVVVPALPSVECSALNFFVVSLHSVAVNTNRSFALLSHASRSVRSCDSSAKHASCLIYVRGATTTTTLSVCVRERERVNVA